MKDIIKTPSIRNLQRELTRLKSLVEDDMKEEEDDSPSIYVTLACDETGFALQTGDNSYFGSAYAHKYWGMSTLYRSSNCTDLARDLIDQCVDLFEGMLV